MGLRSRALPILACILVALFALGAVTASAAADWPAAGERRVSFDAAWRFQKGDARRGREARLRRRAAGASLDLPHDWAIEGPFDPKISPHQGALPFFGVAWYRKHFTVPASARGRYYAIEIDGAMSNATVFLNGRELGGRPYGYIGFSLDLTPHLVFGGENVLAVRLAPEPESSRWYPGRRHLPPRLDRRDGPGPRGALGHVRDDPGRGRRRGDRRRSEPSCATARRSPPRVTLETTILDAEAREVAQSTSQPTVPAGAVGRGPDPGHGPRRPRAGTSTGPYLYTAVSTVRRGDAVLDRYTTPFGIRTIEFGPDKGFLLNGRRVQLQGVCDHHDLGALGAAVNRRAIERQLEILKKMGANAIRTSHNPPSPGAARGRRPHGLPRHGRGLRHVGHGRR